MSGMLGKEAVLASRLNGIPRLGGIQATGVLIPDESCDGGRQVAGEVRRELLTQGVSKCFLKETSKEKPKGVGRPKPPVVGGRQAG